MSFRFEEKCLIDMKNKNFLIKYLKEFNLSRLYHVSSQNNFLGPEKVTHYLLKVTLCP